MGDSKQQDAEYLKLLTIFHYVVAGMMALWGSFPIIHFLVGIGLVFGSFNQSKPGGPPLEFVGLLFAFVAGTFITVGWTLAVCTFFAGRNLARRRHYMYCLIVLESWRPFACPLERFWARARSLCSCDRR